MANIEIKLFKTEEWWDYFHGYVNDKHVFNITHRKSKDQFTVTFQGELSGYGIHNSNNGPWFTTMEIVEKMVHKHISDMESLFITRKYKIDKILE